MRNLFLQNYTNKPNKKNHAGGIPSQPAMSYEENV